MSKPGDEVIFVCPMRTVAARFSAAGLAHVKSCKKKGCMKCHWYRHEMQWKVDFPWLKHDNGCGGAGCVDCKFLFEKNPLQCHHKCLTYAEFRLFRKSALKTHKLRRHASSIGHRAAAKARRRLMSEECVGAPTIEQYKKVLERFRTVTSIGGGDGRGWRIRKIAANGLLH